LLYGPLDEYGLAARIRNVWAKSVPFVEYHRSSVRDLKTEASSTAQDMSYLYLASPVLDLSALGASLPGLGAFAYGELDEGLNPAFGGGLLARWGKKASLSAEGFYTGRELAPRKVQSWFSAPPPLPQREFRVAALGLVFLSPHFALASDLAWSETFAYGRGLYGNAGLRVTFNPWIFSLAADGAGDRFTGRDGAAAGPGFRTAARVERKGKKSSLLRLSGTFRSPGWGEDIDRFTLSAYYRFPAPRTGAFPLGISRLSFALDRDMRESGPPMGYEALLGLRLWFVGAAFSGALGGGTGKASGELSWYPGRFQLRTKLGWTLEGDGEKVWDASIYGALRWKWGRISVKIAATELPRPAPENFTYTLSCRLEKPRRSPARGR
jgi:hypothetical protein